MLHEDVLTDNEDDLTDFEMLFLERSTEDEYFVFQNIEMVTIDMDKCKVIFHYSCSNGVDFLSELYLNVPVDAVNLLLCFNIGMCVLTWYWMAVGTPLIVIHADVFGNLHIDQQRKLQIIQYWELVIYNMMAEYIFVNNLGNTLNNDIRIRFSDTVVDAPQEATGAERGSELDDSTTVSCSPPSTPDIHGDVPPTSTGVTLVPIGGGKDSIVVWHLTPSSQPCTHIAHVADGYSEYLNNSRISQVMKNMYSANIHVVIHEFNYEYIYNHKRSYISTCGHPWAALVLFDMLLVCIYIFM